MSFPLATFEEYLDATILQRGRAYFQQKQVASLEEILPGQYEATVEGSLDYTVTFSLHQGKITHYDCDCPYDDTCKHIAAALYALRQQMQAEPSSGKQSKPATVGEQIEALLAHISHEALLTFVRDTAIRDHAFRSQLQLAFAHLNPHESKDSYREQVKAILRAAGGQNDFIDYSSTWAAAHGVEKLLTVAQKQADGGKANSAWLIGAAVIEEVVEALQYSDDSNGSLGGCIDQALAIFREITQAALPENVRKELFTYAVSAFSGGILDGWDWHLDLLHIASELVATPAEEQQLLAVMDKTEGKKGVDDFSTQALQQARYHILQRIQGEAAAHAYLEQHLANPYFRKKVIQQAFDQQEYSSAAELVLEGIRQDTPRYPGLVKDWNTWLLKIAIAEKKTAQIILLARNLFISGYSFQAELYEMMKTHIAPADWPAFVLGLLDEMKQTGYTLTAEIYIREAWWDKLFELVAKTGRLETIELYEKYLISGYTTGLISLYVGLLPAMMAQSSSRTEYQRVCHYLKRLVNLGGRTKAQELIVLMKATHPTRRAMIEELNNVLS